MMRVSNTSDFQNLTIPPLSFEGATKKKEKEKKAEGKGKAARKEEKEVG